MPSLAGVGEREVAAAVGGRHGLVADREVAHVQLVDRRVLRLRQARLDQRRSSPAGRSDGSVEVDEDRRAPSPS